MKSKIDPNVRHLHDYINQVLLHSSTHHKHSCFWYSCLVDLSLLSLLLSAIPIASVARTALARAGLRNLCSLKVLHGARAIRFLGSVLTRLLAPWTTTSSTSRRERLLRLLPGDRSWDCTANIFLHRPRSATSSKASRIEYLFQLVTAHPLPPALIPPWGTL